MLFLIKFFIGLFILNYSLIHLFNKINIFEQRVLSKLLAQNYLDSSFLKSRQLNVDFKLYKKKAQREVTIKTIALLNHKEEGILSFSNSLIEANDLLKLDDFHNAELSYSKVFSSLYLIQKIQNYSLINIKEILILKDFSPKNITLISGEKLYNLIKLNVVLKKVDCLIRLKRFHKVFFLLNLAQKLDNFLLVKKYFRKTQLKLLYPEISKNYVEKISKKFQVNKNLIYAIMREETHFNNRAKSHAGALGVMQLMPKTAKELHKEINKKFLDLLPLKFNKESLFDFKINIIYGVYYLSKLDKKYRKNEEFVVAAYNAGPTPTKRWIKCTKVKTKSFNDCVTYKETKSYLNRVLNTQEYYKKIYN